MDEAIRPEVGTATRRMRNSPSLSPPPSPDDQANEVRTQGPHGSGGTAFWACVVLGISCLLPWNLFITAHGYFTYKFGSPNNDSASANCSSESSDLAKSFEVYFTLTASIASVLAAFLNVALTSRISSYRRQVGGHGAVILSLIVSLAFCFIKTDEWKIGFLALNLVLIIIGQVGCMFIAGSTYSIAAQLPEARFTNGMVSAQAFCGIFTSVINIVSIAVGSVSHPSVVGAVYFSIALVFMLFSLGSYCALLKNRYAQYYLRKTAFTGVNDDVEPLTHEHEGESDYEAPLDVRNRKVATPPTRKSIWALVRKTLYHGTVLMMTLTATLICFPSLASLVKSNVESTSDWHTYFIPVACFLVFNTMDFIGRLFGNCFMWPKPGSLWIGIFTLLRFGFVFLFLFCNLPSYGVNTVFRDDAYFVLFIALLGVTNGYLANLASIYLPYSVEEHERDGAGASTAFYGAIGVLIGAVISLVVVKQVAE